MRRLYLGVPLEYEDRVLAEIGEVGTLHIIREFPSNQQPEKSRILDLNARFERLNEKLDTILTTKVKKTLAEPPNEPKKQKDLEDVEQALTKSETELADLTERLESREKEIKDLKIIEEKLHCLIMSGLRTDEVGVFRHIFVKAGFLKSSLANKLAGFLGGTSVVSISFSPGRPRENVVIIAGLNDDLAFAEQTLKLLNFEEIAFPGGLNAEPSIALEEIHEDKKLKMGEIKHIKEKMLGIKAKVTSLQPYVVEAAEYEDAKDSVIRTRTKSLIHGWIPSDKVDELEARIRQVVPKEDVHFEVEEPKPEDIVPVQFTNRGITKAFAMFTNLQGVPNYFEINPTPIYTFLYVVMFGMMFGDIGTGISLIVLGVIFTRSRRGFLAFSSDTTKKIASILIACGFGGVFFGFLYGNFFLVKTPWPYLLSPLNNLGEILTIALAFGVAQIILSLILNIVNMARKKDFRKLILGGKGIIALIFYASGVVVGYEFVMERDLNIFFTGWTSILSSIALISLVLIFFSPLIESVSSGKKIPIVQRLLEGFGESLESFVSFIANSVSYIRLAAFAIAHEAIGVAAIALGSVFGSVISLVLLNTLDFLVEGFASLIQSLRLMYYEFSTRFYLKNGIEYKPFRLGLIRMKI